jgi:hypothetical protein
MPLEPRKSSLLAIVALVFGFLFGALGAWHLIDVANEFIQSRTINVWFLIAQIWPFAMAVYLVFVGVRKLSTAGTDAESAIAKIGWGRVIVGTYLIVSSVVTHYRPDSNRPLLKPSNEMQAMAMNATQDILTICFPVLGAILAAAGVRKGFKQEEGGNPNMTGAPKRASN